MKIIIAAVMSVNGKITSGDKTRVHDWSSPEDRKYFSALIKKSELVIMGRKTFLAARADMKLSTAIHRVVLTKKPAMYKKFEVPKQLEFTDESPRTLMKRLEKYHRTAMLVGGTETNSTFLREKLIDELWLTVEPKIFGYGKGLFSEKNLNVGLQLRSMKQLNKNGTLLLKYTVMK